MNFRIFLASFSVVILSACGQQGQQERLDEATTASKSGSDSLYSRVLDDHNIAMKKMGQLTRYQELCRKTSDSLAALLSRKKDPSLMAQKARVDSLQTQLKGAEEDMDHWMEAFEPDSAGSDEASKLKYYAAEKNKVGAIKDNMISLLAKADSVLKK